MFDGAGGNQTSGGGSAARRAETQRSPGKLRDRMAAFEDASSGTAGPVTGGGADTLGNGRAKSPGLRSRMAAFEGGGAKPPLPGGKCEAPAKSRTVSAARQRAAAFEASVAGGDGVAKEEKRDRETITGKSPSIRERMAQMNQAQEASSKRAPSRALAVDVGDSLSDRMADLEADLQMNEDRAREKAMYKGAGSSQDIYGTAADLESQGLGGAIMAQNASGASVCTSGAMEEDRRTVKNEANKVMH